MTKKPISMFCHDAVLKEDAVPRQGEILNTQGDSIPVEIRTRSMDGDVPPMRVTALRDLSFQRAMERETSNLSFEDEEPLDPEHDLNRSVEALERRMIRASLQKSDWHRGRAADLLGIPRRTLQRKMIKYGFRNPSPRG